MNPQEILEKKQKIIHRFGPWTAHNIHLGHAIYTIDNRVVGQEVILRRVIQVIHDIAHRPLQDLRILDLACCECLYGIELALRGAKVVGIEAREANLEKARFVQEILDLRNLELIQDDVRHISITKYGRFDVVICAGILYHLDVPDVFHFIEQIFEMGTHFSIFETHVSITAKEEHVYARRKYFGRSVPEHSPDSNPDEKMKSLWASIDNVKGFWFTRPSLLNFLSHTGFTSVYECHNPSAIRDWADRVTLVALKGTRTPLLCAPLLNSEADDDWPEKSARRIYPAQERAVPQSVRVLGRFIPNPVKGFLRRLVGM